MLWIYIFNTNYYSESQQIVVMFKDLQTNPQPTNKEREHQHGAPFLFVAIIRREKEPPTTQPTNNKSKANNTSEAATIQEAERAKAIHKNT